MALNLPGFWITTILCPPCHWCCCSCKGSVLAQETDSHLQHPKRSGSLPNCRYADAAARTEAATYGMEKRSRAGLVWICLNWSAAIPASQSDSSRNLQQKLLRSLRHCASPMKYLGPSSSSVHLPYRSKWFINSWVYLDPVLKSGIGAFNVLQLHPVSLPVHLRRTLFISLPLSFPRPVFHPNSGS